MRPKHLVREALAAARSSPIPSLLVLLVVGSMCFSAIVTVGRQAAVESALAAEIAGPHARTLTITDTSSTEALRSSTLDVLAGLRHTQAVIGRDRPVDAVNGALGEGSTPVAVAGLHGTVERAVEIIRGRPPGPGQVMIPAAMMEVLRLEEPAGYLEARDGSQWAIVAAFEPRPPFEDLATMALTLPHAVEASHQQIRIVVEDVEHVTAVRSAAFAIIDADPTQVQVSTPSAASNQGITDQIAGLGRSLLLIILGAGAFFVSTVVLADVLIRRRDLGRRRTLGITRSDLVTLVALRTSAPATLGAVLGAVGGYLLVARELGTVPVDFALATTVLAVLTATIACLPPAAYAANRDPVEVMRTP